MNQQEMMYLVTMLKLNKVMFSLEVQPHFNTLQVFYPSKILTVYDVVCHELSAGGKDGLLEILDHETGEWKGYLTGAEAYEIIFKHWKKAHH